MTFLRRRPRSRLTALIASITLGLGLALGGAAVGAPAQAHSDLISTDPVDGAVLDAAPTEVVFTFSEALLPDFVRFIRIDAAGETADLGVNAIENKPYTDQQRSTVEASGFLIWLDGYRTAAEISIDGAVVQEAGESPAP